MKNKNTIFFIKVLLYLKIENYLSKFKDIAAMS